MGANRKLFVELGVNDRKLSAGLRRSEKKFAKHAKNIRRKMGGAFNGLSLGLLAGAGMGFAGAAGDVKSFEQSLEDLRVQAGKTVAGVAAIRGQADGLADIGVDRNKLIVGVATVVDLLGKDALNGRNISLLGRAMVASGAEGEDLARVMWALQESYNFNPKQIEEAFGVILSIGKSGSMPLKEMAQELPRLMATYIQAGGDASMGGLKKQIAILQVAKDSFGSAGQAATGLDAAINQLGARHKEIKKVLGVDVFEKFKGADGKTRRRKRDSFDLMKEFAESEKLKRDPRLLEKALGRRAEARKMIETFMQKEDKLSKLESAADVGALDKDVADRQNSPIGKLNRANAKMKVSMAKAFTPERIEKFAKAVEKLSDVVLVLVDNIGTAVALFAAAKLGPGLAGMAFSGAGMLGGTATGAAINAAKTGAMGTAGLAGSAAMLAGIGVASYMLTDALMEATGASEGLANIGLKVFGAWGKVAEAAPSNRVGALQKRLANGEITQEEFDKGRVSAAETFAYRGTAAITDLVGGGILKETGDSKQELQARYNAIDKEGQDRIREMARQVLISEAKGQDTSALLDKIASAIQGAPIHVNIAGEAINRIVDKSVAVRTDI